MKVKERIAYIRGLIEGSEFHGRDERAQAIWNNLMLVCDSLADSVESLWESLEDVEEYLEAIDLDLADLEDEADGDGSDLIELECGHCGEDFCVEEEFLDDENAAILCPKCGRDVSLTYIESEAPSSD